MNKEVSIIVNYLRLFVVLALLAEPWTKAIACSGVASDNDAMPLLAGNYDWHARGGVAFVSPRNQWKQTRIDSQSLDKNSPLAPAASWSAKYASITISQFGRDFPMQGMNEKGLAGLVLMGEAEYPVTGPLGVMTENFWLQYQLDQFATVQEVIDHVEDFAIKKLSAPLHWFLCDQKHECAVIEFLKGRAHVYSRRQLPHRVLANTSYAKSMLALSEWEQSRPDGQHTELPRGYLSQSRFIRLSAWPSKSDSEDLKSLLDDVKKDGFTAWHSVFNMDALSIDVKLPEQGEPWMTLDFNNLNLDCQQQLPMLNLNDKIWKSYDHQQVAELFKRAAQGTTGLGDAVQEQLLRQSEHIQCHSGR